MDPEQNVGTPEQQPTNPPEPVAPRFCEACGAPLPDMATLNIPEALPGAPTVTLTAEQAHRFRAAYLSLYTFWLICQSQNGLGNESDALRKVGL
jgi:hypothetical protein